MKKIERSTKLKYLDAERLKAMPDVKKMLKKHGRKVVTWCINQIKQYEKKLKQLDAVKKEAERLQKELY